MQQLPTSTEMSRAILASDASYDGVFYFGVRTTGIFCRPSCASKKPLLRNVEFFPTPKQASFAGYRPCKRCRPLEAPGTPPRWAAQLIAAIENDPATPIRQAELRRRGLDPARVRRFFQNHYGMTFAAYCRGRRMSTAFHDIRNGHRVEDIAIGSGFASSSGFRAAYGKTFGSAPAADHQQDIIRVGWLDSPLGPLVAAANEQGLLLLEFTERRMLDKQFDTLRRHFKTAIVPGEHRYLTQVRDELQRYFAGMLKDFTVPLAFPGSAFQREVWNGLLEIPYGATWSYEQLAKRVGRAGASRAVGTTNGLNRLAIVIPCHRVVNKSGGLGGYAGGLWRKQRLLELEQGDRNDLFLPPPKA